MNLTAVGSYKIKRFKKLAVGIKNNSMIDIILSARLMSRFVSSDSLLIPIPSHHGYATNTLKLANLISKKTGAEVLNILEGRSRESFCELKRNGNSYIKGDFFGFRLKENSRIPENRKLVLIDNVYATGKTAQNAEKVIGQECECLVLANASIKLKDLTIKGE